MTRLRQALLIIPFQNDVPGTKAAPAATKKVAKKPTATTARKPLAPSKGTTTASKKTAATKTSKTKTTTTVRKPLAPAKATTTSKAPAKKATTTAKVVKKPGATVAKKPATKKISSASAAKKVCPHPMAACFPSLTLMFSIGN